MSDASKRLWTTVAAWFLAVTYGIGAPFTAWLESRDQLLSQRFDLPPTVIYATCLVQLVCAVGVVKRGWASWAALGLTVTTIGAIGSHLRIGSAETAWTAVVYTAIQLWVAFARRDDRVRLGGPAPR